MTGGKYKPKKISFVGIKWDKMTSYGSQKMDRLSTYHQSLRCNNYMPSGETMTCAKYVKFLFTTASGKVKFTSLKVSFGKERGNL